MTTTVGALLSGTEIGTSLPRRERQKLLASITGHTDHQLLAHPEATVEAEHIQRYFALCRRRTQGEPMAYLLGECGFWSLDLAIDPRALIPRPDTELLVEFALDIDLPENARVADLGTGSGAIALALGVEKPAWSVTAVERDPDAASLCAENILRTGAQNVELLTFDWCNLEAGPALDLVLSNPPYVEEGFPDLERSLRFEPRQALAAGSDGLDALREVIPLASRLLKSGGWCAVEHGFTQGPPVRAFFAACGYALIATHKDLAGHERITVGRWVTPP